MRYVCFLSMHYVIVVVSNCVCLFILIEWHRLHKKNSEFPCIFNSFFLQISVQIFSQ